MNTDIYQAKLEFREIKNIGQEGKNSQVFLAHDLQLDGQIVIKKIEKGKLAVDAYHKEARLLYSSAHNNVVSVNYGCEDNDYIYVAMPFYKNGSLKKLIGDRFLTVREVIRYSIHFLSGLNHIHTKGLIHFDVKPDNILLSDSNQALLADFGLSKAMKLNGFAEAEAVYLKHAPPERFDRHDFSYHYDIYAAGLTIYRMLNGDERFYEHYNKIKGDLSALKFDIRNGRFPDRKAYLPHIPAALRKIINKAIEPNPINRHKNVLELINELSTVDKNLDWQYSEPANVKEWTLQREDKTISLYLTNNTGIFDLKASKSVNASGKVSRIVKYCAGNLSYEEATKLLLDAIKEYQ